MNRRDNDSSMEENGSALETIVLRRKERVKKYLGIGSIGATAIFLFLPDIAIFDFLPDFIGYMILLFGISQLRDLNDYFGDAYDRFYKFAWISFAKFASFFLVLGLVTSREQPDTMLLLSFVFGVFEFLFLIPAWRDLFEGFSYMTAKYGVTDFELKRRKPRRMAVRRRGKRRHGEKREYVLVECPPINRIERIKARTIGFVIFKSVLTVLPEFAALSADTELSTTVRLYDFIGLLRMCAMFFVLIAGIVWLASLCRFLYLVKRDRPFVEFMKERYRCDVLTKDSIFVHRHLQNALFFAAVAMVFRVDFRLDYMHVIPDALLGLLLVVAVLLLGNHVGKRSMFFVCAGVFSVFSAALNLYEYNFYYNHTITSIQVSESVLRAYHGLLVGKVVEQILFILMILLFLSLLRNVIRRYTGFSVTAAETRSPSDRIREIHRGLEKKLGWVLGLAIATAVHKVLDVVFALEQRAGYGLDWLPITNFLLAAVFAAVTIKTIRDIYSQVEYRFMLT